MNILVVVPWDQEYGGVAAVVGNVGRQLQQKGHTVVFLHPGGDSRLQKRITAWKFEGFRLNLRPPYSPHALLKSIAAFWFYLVPTLFQLNRLLRRQQIDLVNIHYPSEQFVYFALLRHVRRFQLVLSFHGADLFPDGQPKHRYGRTIRFLLNSADLLITPSQSSLNDVLAVFPWLTPRGRFVHNGVDLAEFCSDDRTPAPVSPYILCVAIHNAKKAIDVLLKAFAELHRTDRSLELWLVGDGPLRGELEHLARELGLDGKVRFLGARGRDDVRRYMRECLLFVLPSRAEPFGIVILEALASRKAVVATKAGGIPEIIQDGVTGVLVAPDDPTALCEAMRGVVRDQALRERLADHGYRLVTQRYPWSAAGERYDAMFRALHDRRAVPDA